MEKSLESAVEHIKTASIVVSGAGGSGKTALIKRTMQKTEHELVEIDNIEEYMAYRIKSTIVYLLRVTEEVRVKKSEYRGIIFETDQPYFYRKIKNCIHIRVSLAPIRIVRQYCPAAASKTSMHRIVQTAKMPKEIHSLLLENESTSISFFHAIGKILYHKTKEIPTEVQNIIEKDPFKTLVYIHENISEFTGTIRALSRVLDKVSLATNSTNLMYKVIHEIWQLEKHTPKSFYSIKSPYRMDL